MPTHELSSKAASVRKTVQSSLKSTIELELAEDSQISRLMFSKSTHSKSATNTGARQKEKTLKIDNATIDQIAARLAGVDAKS